MVSMAGPRCAREPGVSAELPPLPNYAVSLGHSCAGEPFRKYYTEHQMREYAAAAIARAPAEPSPAAAELIAAFESLMIGFRDQSWAEWQNGNGTNVGKKIDDLRKRYYAEKNN